MANATEAPAPAEGPTSHTHFQAGPGGYTRDEQKTALLKLRAPFPPESVSVRPGIDCRTCEDSSDGVCPKHHKVECTGCGQIVTVAHTDLSYVDHAEITDRLLDADPFWDWEPLAVDRSGLPLIDDKGGLWIRLTVAGMTRLGYGDVRSKQRDTGAVKEVIGNAIRNAGMRFGMSLDLWKTAERRTRAAADRIAVGIPEAPTLRLRKLVEWSKAHWGDLDRLTDVARWVTAEGFADALVDGPGGVQPFGPLLERQLAYLGTRPPATTGPAQHTPGAAAPVGEQSQDTGAPAPGEAPDEPHHQDQEQADAPAPEDEETLAAEDAQLQMLARRVLDLHWDKPHLLEQDLAEVRRQELQDHNVEAPAQWGSTWMRFETLIDRRLRELEQAANGTGRNAA